ncbi:MAG: RNA 3'-terminal phosphate cyclase [Deltaproteobacteria bacterium]|nr:RNA 3'-terminal phosphate cyclase [Deltaproteobacteria bacterium]
MVILDGSQGEGGGQILRSALALSLITGQAFRIDNIRAGRARPGLLRQHLTAVEAAATIGNARVEGAAIGARSVAFAPSKLQGGAFMFSVGTAGSTTLVLQTVLPALLTAPAPSTIILEGGTHNPSAPPFDFLADVYLPLVARMGPQVKVVLERPGFYPAGGGRLRVEVAPTPSLSPLVLLERGAIKRRHARVLIANLPRAIAAREVEVVASRLGLASQDCVIEQRSDSAGPGNAVLVYVEAEHVTEVMVGFGEKRVRAEAVAEEVATAATEYLESDVPVGPHLADQLVLLLALAQGSCFRTSTPTMHARTQLETISKFMGRVVHAEQEAAGTWRFDGRSVAS